MAATGQVFLGEMQALVARKHSKDHPIFGMLARGELSREQLQGFVKQFYLLFPKPFPKPIAAMFAKSPEDSELERMWMENLQEEAAGADTGTAGHKELYIRFAGAMGIPRDELDATGKRAIRPEQAAPDALVIDTDGLTVEEVVASAVEAYETANVP